MTNFGAMKVIVLIVAFAISLTLSLKPRVDKKGKILPVFQVVRFPNDPCTVSGGTKNGTCYTEEECSNKGGTNAGSCAQGFGICCTFTVGCGDTIAENTTYFESATSVTSGACRVSICKSNPDICKIRLDFNSFVITGPSTSSYSITASSEYSDQTRCLTDVFSITNQYTVPDICGTNTGYHVYFDAHDGCNDMTFFLGPDALGVSTVATRSWSIKATQMSCDDENLPPDGCTQWHFGAISGSFESFNWAPQTLHLANQIQTTCIRRESNYCAICWYNGPTDFSISGTGTSDVGTTACCGAGIKGFDCLMLPGAYYGSTASPTYKEAKQCGQGVGIKGVTTTAGIMTSYTICSKELPFRVHFITDGYEDYDAHSGTPTPNPIATKGFKLYYTMTAC